MPLYREKTEKQEGRGPKKLNVNLSSWKLILKIACFMYNRLIYSFQKL